MFNETHLYNGTALAFIKSVNVQAFPCGRRSSANQLEDSTEKYYFPFDPESRLSTEANTRKHSSLNGFAQTYLQSWDKDDKKLLTMSLAGYLFSIALTGKNKTLVNGEQVYAPFDYSTPNAFGNRLATYLHANDATCIYANILLEDVHLFSSKANEYFTSILRDQYDTTDIQLAASDAVPETLLDLINKATVDGQKNLDSYKDPHNYYFSGLSFSTSPITGKGTTRSSLPVQVERVNMPKNTTNQLLVSLRILDKVKVSSEGATPEVFEWQIHQPAHLPKVEHGSTENSAVIGDLLVANLDIEETGHMSIPYTGIVEFGWVDENDHTKGKVTKIVNDGVYAPYVSAGLIDAEGIAVGDSVGVKNKEGVVVTVLGENITTYGNVTADGTITAKTALSVQSGVEGVSATATIDKADITEATIGTDTITKANITDADITSAIIGTETVGTSTITTADITEATIDTADITEATIGTAGITAADIGTATIGTATVTDTTTDNLTVNTKATIAEADIETADINTLTGNTATITTIKSDGLNQKVNGTYYDVPVMFLEKDNTASTYQLKISRINKIGF